MNAATWKSIGLGVLAAALQALLQGLLAHHVDPVTAGAAGTVTGAAYAARSPFTKRSE